MGNTLIEQEIITKSFKARHLSAGMQSSWSLRCELTSVDKASAVLNVLPRFGLFVV